MKYTCIHLNVKVKNLPRLEVLPIEEDNPLVPAFYTYHQHTTQF